MSDGVNVYIGAPDGQTAVSVSSADTIYVTVSAGFTGSGGGGGATNLSTTRTATTVTVNSDTGTDATIAAADGTNAGVMTAAMFTKLDGINTAALVPYTGASGDVNLGEHGVQLGNLEFDNTPTNTPTTDGSVFWDSGDGTLQLQMKGGVIQQVGMNQFARVYNDTASAFTKGQVVYISGAQGNRIAAKLARADSELTSRGTIGFVTESIAAGAEGNIIVSGPLYKLNTNGLTAGNPLYLSAATAGAYTETAPQAPNHLVVLGYVERVSATVGSIYVKVDNGYELEELHDVDLTESKATPVDADAVLLQDSADSSVWKRLTWANLKATLLSYFNGEYVAKNAAITGATKTKITYDAKGLVTAGADATTADIADSNDKRYVTEAEKTKLSNLSGTNTGDQNLFSTIAVSGQSSVVADGTGDTLTLVAGSNVTITTDASTDSITIAASGGGGGISDGDKGDITVSSSGTVWTIDNSVVTLAKMADMATSSLIYRKTAGTGAPEVQSLSTLKTDLGLTGTNSGDQTITLTGDVTGSGTGSFAATIANDAVTFAKMQNSAAAGLSVIGRNTNSAGDFAEINAGTDGHVLRRAGTAVGFGTLASGAFANNTIGRSILTNATALSVIGRSANSSGAPADIAAANDGEVLRRSGTTLGFGTIATAGIADDAVTNAKLANMATATIKGRTTAGTGDPEDLTATQATALLNEFTTSLKGLAPASGGGTTNFLRADGTWAAPSGGGGISDGDKGDITVSSSGTVWTIDNGVVSDAKLGTGIDAAKIANGQVSNTEFQYLDGVTSAIQTQLNAKVTGFADPNADRIVFWDDSASAYAALEVGSGLSISGTTLTATGGGGGGDLTVLDSNNTQTGPLNTTTETALYSFNLPTDLAAGETLILEFSGNSRQGEVAAMTWDLRVKLGGTTIMSRSFSQANLGQRTFTGRLVMNVLDPTNSQKISYISQLSSNDPGTLSLQTYSSAMMNSIGYDTAAENLTSTKALEITMQMATASANAFTYIQMATLYRLAAP